MLLLILSISRVKRLALFSTSCKHFTKIIREEFQTQTMDPTQDAPSHSCENHLLNAILCKAGWYIKMNCCLIEIRPGHKSLQYKMDSNMCHQRGIDKLPWEVRG